MPDTALSNSDINSINRHINLGVGTIVRSILQMGKQRYGETG